MALAGILGVSFLGSDARPSRVVTDALFPEGDAKPDAWESLEGAFWADSPHERLCCTSTTFPDKVVFWFSELDDVVLLDDGNRFDKARIEADAMARRTLADTSRSTA